MNYSWKLSEQISSQKIKHRSAPIYTVEPPNNKGHFGANSFVPCREVVPISEVKNTCREAVPISEGPLSVVPLYIHQKFSLPKMITFPTAYLCEGSIYHF